MKILLLGRYGQIGSELNAKLRQDSSYKLLSLSRRDCDFENFQKLNKYIYKFKPNVIINAAAYTNVDNAEIDNKKCLILNSDMPHNISKICSEQNIILIHYSTDYVFDGKKEEAYHEDDSTNPINFYGKSKLLGETNIRNTLLKHLIIRTSWVYSSCSRNFLKTIVNLSKTQKNISIIDDQYGTPTSALFIAEMTLLFLKKINTNYNQNIFGTYHITPDGETNWYNFAKLIINILIESKYKTLCSLDDIKAIKTEDYQSKAERPKYSVLRNNKFKLLFDNNIQKWERYVKPVILDLLRNNNDKTDNT